MIVFHCRSKYQVSIFWLTSICSEPKCHWSQQKTLAFYQPMTDENNSPLNKSEVIKQYLITPNLLKYYYFLTMSTSDIGPILRTMMSTSTMAGGPKSNYTVIIHSWCHEFSSRMSNKINRDKCKFVFTTHCMVYRYPCTLMNYFCCFYDK